MGIGDNWTNFTEESKVCLIKWKEQLTDGLLYLGSLRKKWEMLGILFKIEVEGTFVFFLAGGVFSQMISLERFSSLLIPPPLTTYFYSFHFQMSQFH